MRNSKAPPLVVESDAVQFDGRKVYWRDVTEIVAGGGAHNPHYFPITLRTSHGDHTFNLFDYSVKVTGADAFVDEIRGLWRVQQG